MYLVTGGAGFIGSNLVRHLLEARPGARVVVYDALTYAGSRENLDGLPCTFVEGDVVDRARLSATLEEHRPEVLFHLAAESHVDRSIDAPGAFVRTNVVGTYEVLEAARGHVAARPELPFRVVHVSTDEVYGSLGAEGAFDEGSPYAPNSPYAASKAGGDMLVRAYRHTYGLPVVCTHASNNYGPYQLPEKLVPLTILNALEGGALPIYGDGQNVRDWLHVRDHARALLAVAERGRLGERYNIGAGEERTTLAMVHAVCDVLDRLRGGSHRDLARFVRDRPGHDFRYAIDARKIRGELGWQPEVTFADGLAATVRWYLEHPAWCARARARLP